MKPNVGSLDRIIRAIAGAILIILGLVLKTTLAVSIILLLLGVILFATAILRFCPLYVPFKFNTLNKK